MLYLGAKAATKHLLCADFRKTYQARYYLSARHILSCSFKSIITLFFFTILCSKNAAAIGVNKIATDINGHRYLITLVPRDDTDLPSPDDARHFSGTVHDLPRIHNWARLSNIAGKWQGLISIKGEYHEVIGVNNMAMPMSSEVELILNTRPVHRPGEEDEVSLGCGSSSDDGHQMSDDHDTFSTTLKNTFSSFSAASTSGSASMNLQSSAASLDFELAIGCDQKVDGVCIVAEIEFAFDQQFQAVFGSQAEANAFSLVNIVEGIYLNNFGIAFKKTSINLLNSEVFSNTTNSATLLQDIFLKKQNNQIPSLQNTRSLFHLVSGRDFNGSTVGYAYVDTLCSNAGVGTSQLWRNGFGSPDLSTTAIIIAHEIGHNFGAVHDSVANNCGTGYVMQSVISSAAQEFSQCSTDTVQNAISNLATPSLCFDYPVDVSLQASVNNPESSTSGEIFLLEYEVYLETGVVGANSLVIDGDVPLSEGAIYSATLNGVSCTINGNYTEYHCEFSQPNENNILQITASANTAGASFVHFAKVSNIFDAAEQLNDVSPENNFHVTNINRQADEPAPTQVVSSATENTSNISEGSQSGGGGSATILSFFIFLVTILKMSLGVISRNTIAH